VSFLATWHNTMCLDNNSEPIKIIIILGNIFTFLLQIAWSKQLLMFVLNVKRYFNIKKDAFLSAYLLITDIHTYWSYGDGIALPRTWKGKSSEMKSMFCVKYNFKHKIIVMVDDRCDRWHIWVQHLFGFSHKLVSSLTSKDYWKISKLHISLQ